MFSDTKLETKFLAWEKDTNQITFFRFLSFTTNYGSIVSWFLSECLNNWGMKDKTKPEND